MASSKSNDQTVGIMATIPTTSRTRDFVFLTTDTLNDRSERTSPILHKCESCEPERAYKQLSPLLQHIRSKHPHLPFLYNCESCNRVFNFKKISSLLNHFQAKHPLVPLPYNCESCKLLFDTSTGLQKHNETKHRRLQANDCTTPASSVIEMDANDLSSRIDDDDDRDTNVNGCGSLEDAAQRNPTLAENHPSALLTDNISKYLPPVSELTASPSPSSSSAAGPSPSKLDKATAVARAALRNRFAELGVKSGETTPLFKSNIWDPSKASSSVSNLDGSNSSATNLTLDNSNSNQKEVDESELPLNLLDNTTRPFPCPGCRIDFKTFSGFVLHIENRLCRSSMYHEIEDQLNACVAQIFSRKA